jgi:hypothetical protein
MTPGVIAPRSISVATNRKAEEVVADAANCVRPSSGIVDRYGRGQPNHGCGIFGIHQMPDESISPSSLSDLGGRWRIYGRIERRGYQGRLGG